MHALVDTNEISGSKKSWEVIKAISKFKILMAVKILVKES